VERRAPLRRFQFLQKIINAIAAPMRFDGGMTRRDGQMNSLPACFAIRFGALIGKQNQLGADL
jgi:hypothetical protein